MKIGILGGAFDPPHIGHMVIAEIFAEEYELDKVIWVPTFKSAFGKVLSPAPHRLAMTYLAVDDSKVSIESSYETQKGEISYTIDTLKYMKKMYPDAELFFLVGEDNVLKFPEWKDPNALFDMATLVYHPRKNTEFSGIGIEIEKKYSIKRMHSIYIDISSTQIRDRIKNGQTIKYMVHKDVEKYIKEHKLYKD